MPRSRRITSVIARPANVVITTAMPEHARHEEVAYGRPSTIAVAAEQAEEDEEQDRQEEREEGARAVAPVDALLGGHLAEVAPHGAALPSAPGRRPRGSAARPRGARGCMPRSSAQPVRMCSAAGRVVDLEHEPVAGARGWCRRPATRAATRRRRRAARSGSAAGRRRRARTGGPIATISPVAHHGHAVGERLRLVHVVRRQEDRRAGGGEAARSSPRRRARAPGSKPVVGSSRNSSSGLPTSASADVEAPALAARQRPHAASTPGRPGRRRRAPRRPAAGCGYQPANSSAASRTLMYG